MAGMPVDVHGTAYRVRAVAVPVEVASRHGARKRVHPYILSAMRVLCVGRHALLADHIASVFRSVGTETRPVVGLREAAEVAARELPDAVLCDYDLLATNPLTAWEQDPVLADLPVVAVSLTRRPDEACAFDVNGISGFLYLPTLDRDAALRMLRGLSGRTHGVDANGYTWPASPDARAARPAG